MHRIYVFSLVVMALVMGMSFDAQARTSENMKGNKK